LNYFTIHLMHHLTSLCSLLANIHDPRLSHINFHTPFLIHHSTNTSTLLLMPVTSDATRYMSSTNSRLDTISSPHSTSNFFFFSSLTALLIIRERVTGKTHPCQNPVCTSNSLIAHSLLLTELAQLLCLEPVDCALTHSQFV